MDYNLLSNRIKTSRRNRNWNCYSPTIQLPDTICWMNCFIRTAVWWRSSWQIATRRRTWWARVSAWSPFLRFAVPASCTAWKIYRRIRHAYIRQDHRWDRWDRRWRRWAHQNSNSHRHRRQAGCHPWHQQRRRRNPRSRSCRN